MPASKTTTGLASILLAFVITRLAVYFSHAPTTIPEQIWRTMPAALKFVVLAAAALFVFGCRELIKGVIHQIQAARASKHPAS